jgi:hypothetical protein
MAIYTKETSWTEVGEQWHAIFVVLVTRTIWALAAAIATWLCWNVLADHFGWPLVMYKHAVAVNLGILALKLVVK